MEKSKNLVGVEMIKILEMAPKVLMVKVDTPILLDS